MRRTLPNRDRDARRPDFRYRAAIRSPSARYRSELGKDRRDTLKPRPESALRDRLRRAPRVRRGGGV